MAKKKPKPGSRDADWTEAKRRCRLSEEEVRMARDLGISPRSLIKNIPSPSQPWKAPVKVWVRELYFEKQAKTTKKKSRRQAELDRDPPPMVDVEPVDADGHDWPGDPDRSEDVGDTLTAEGIAEANRDMMRRQREFRKAAELVAQALAELPQVQRVVLFGSVAALLCKEVPRFNEFRRAGAAIWHECKDVDLAVWVTDLEDLKSLQLARSRALTSLWEDHQIGVAHHQVDLLLMEPGSDRYLGRLCCFGQCPKGKPECRVPDCGQKRFLRQHQDFVFKPESLGSDTSVLLFTRWIK